ncbi:MAG: hypothetical protein WCA10_00555 [Terracidiphilus sp.]
MCDARLLAIIPARGGSKRLAHKNIRLLGGRPLVAWSITSALEAELFCDVLVRTEEQRVAEAAKAAGAFVQWLCPADLASDEAATTDVLHHADPLLGWEQIGLKSQDIEPSFKLNGSIYVIPAPTIRNGGNLIVPATIAFTMSEAEEAVDIDTERDWQMAEFFLVPRQC